MKEQEEKSGVSYQEVQRAEAEEIMASAIHGVHRVDIEGNESDEEGDMDKNAPEEREKVLDRKRRFESFRGEVGLDKFNDIDGDLIADSADSIAKDCLLNEPKVSEEMWNQSHPEQEKENFIQEELYPHDKVLIVDDRIAVCGSSNINDRSQLGYHDSELSIVMEDTNMIDSVMDGKLYQAGFHAATLRRNLWKEHMGLITAQPLDASDDPNAQPPEDCMNDIQMDEYYQFVEDPLNEDVWKMWTERATVNTEVFRHLFHVSFLLLQVGSTCLSFTRTARVLSIAKSYFKACPVLCSALPAL